jgi:hypothetical protein
VRARRIKGLEADKRKEERSQADAQKFLCSRRGKVGSLTRIRRA